MIYTTNLCKKLFFIALLSIFSMGAYGQEHLYGNASMPSLFDYTSGNGFSQALGLKFKYGTVYRGSDESVLEATLDGAAQWRKGRHLFFVENYDLNGIELGWRNFIRPSWLIQSGVRHETVLPSSRTTEAGISEFPHRGSQIFGFVELRRSLNPQWDSWVSGRISGGPSDFGIRGELAIGRQFFQNVNGSAAELELFSTFGDENQLNNYYGITQTDAATSGLAQIDLEGGYRSSGINALYRHRFYNRVQGVVTGRLEYYSSEVNKSELVNDGAAAAIDASLLFLF